MRSFHQSLQVWLIGFPAYLAATVLAARAPLEPFQGMLFGGWLDTTPNQDTPLAFNQRLNYTSTLFQMALEIPLASAELPPVTLLDATGSNPVLLLTVSPRFNSSFSRTGNEAFDQLADPKYIAEFADLIAGYVQDGRRVLLRIASEMNGSWYAWGQRPLRYVALWRRIVTSVRSRLSALGGTAGSSVAFLWSPNAAANYPYYGGAYTPFTDSDGPLRRNASNDVAEFDQLDTNADGELDENDDPFSPYWPGTEYVDWVGMSVYYFGRDWPWVHNDLPPTDFVTRIVDGVGDGDGKTTATQRANFYLTYSSDLGINRKPMIFSETASAFHVRLLSGANTTVDPGPGELGLKGALWRQYITNSTFLTLHPKIRGVCLFEYAKPEEDTFRDYRVTWKSDVLAAFKEDLDAVRAAHYDLAAEVIASPAITSTTTTTKTFIASTSTGPAGSKNTSAPGGPTSSGIKPFGHLLLPLPTLMIVLLCTLILFR
ncbi:glycoside hydrolase superfamily [Fimicolochytrium jonesii]|uniref:glycoside hydrolase superfamily n=1 Tax=Fimicolochytrium jonesii TaxID=1396493 RepID=UPI0022FE8068|nr:glycoside hydrolase superfamily [Fimicolochytrium jonesii]KAI8825155.1 glycoside hydrolase superfamily [Fimicolochytrium jonesii]